MKTITRNEQIINKKEADTSIESADTRIALIQALIPIGLQCVNELLQQEVEELAHARYSRRKEKGRDNYR